MMEEQTTETVEDQEKESECQELMKEFNLPHKRALFVLELSVDYNKTQAAIRAGYSEKTANEQGSRLLTFVSVQEAVDKVLQEKDSDRLIRRRRNITVLEDIRDTPEKKMILEGVQVKGGESRESKNSFHTFKAMNTSNKIKAIDTLSKINGDFPNKIELTGANGGPVETAMTYKIVDPKESADTQEAEKE